jgi:transcriptional regulator with XRE-family HTH domain
MRKIERSDLLRVGEFLRNARQEAGLTIPQVAKDLDLGISSISRAETGSRQLAIHTIARILVRCGSSLGALYNHLDGSHSKSDPSRPPAAQLDTAFARIMHHRKSAVIAPYHWTGWGDDLALQDCPEVSAGWPIAEVGIRCNTAFDIPDTFRDSYERYFQLNYDKRGFFHDGRKYMLFRNPTSFTDSPSVSLELSSTKYSVVQFYRDNVASSAALRDAFIEELVRGSLECRFAHAFCLHATIVTADHKILITRRSPKVGYYPGAWSASLEEQLSDRDFQAQPSEVAASWGGRLLLEELGLGPEAYRPDDFRILAVFLESDILNTSLCGYVTLQLESSALTDVICGHPRSDTEFSEWDFVDLSADAILLELLRPRRHYHPTTGIRLLYTYYKNFGIPSREQLERLELL